jgi:hypothetical protein
MGQVFLSLKKPGNTSPHAGSGIIHKNLTGVYKLLQKYEKSFSDRINTYFFRALSGIFLSDNGNKSFTSVNYEYYNAR